MVEPEEPEALLLPARAAKRPTLAAELDELELEEEPEAESEAGWELELPANPRILAVGLKVVEASAEAELAVLEATPEPPEEDGEAELAAGAAAAAVVEAAAAAAVVFPASCARIDARSLFC